MRAARVKTGLWGEPADMTAGPRCSERHRRNPGWEGGVAKTEQRRGGVVGVGGICIVTSGVSPLFRHGPQTTP